MKHKTLRDKISLVLMLGFFVLLIYGVVYATVINKVVGPGSAPGEGIIERGDSLHVLPGYGMKIDNDSVELNCTVIADSLVILINLDEFDYQTAWRVFYSDGSGDFTELALGADGTYLKSNGATSAPTFATPPGGDPGAAIDDSITSGWQIWQKIDTITAKIPTATLADSCVKYDTANAVTYTEMRTEIKTGAEIYQKLDTSTAKIPTATLADSALAFTWQGIKSYHMDSTSNNFVFDDAFHVTSAVADSEYSTKGFMKAYSADAVHDSIWVLNCWQPKNLSLGVGVPAGVNIYYPLFISGTLSHANVLRTFNSSATADVKDTSVFSERLSGRFLNDADSITIYYRTTDTDSAGACFRLRVFAMRALSGPPLADTLKFGSPLLYSSVAGAWKWYSVSGASIGAIGSNSLVQFRIEKNTDANDTVDVDWDYTGLWAMTK